MLSLVYPDVSGRQATYEGLVLSMTPVGYWSLQETNGTVAEDSGSGGNDGTYNNTPMLGAPGPIARVAGGSRSVSFNGTDEYVEINGVTEDRNGSFTVAAWVKPLNIAANADCPIARGAGVAFTGWAWRQAGSRIALLVPNAALDGWLTTTECQTGVLVDDTWYHIAFVKNGADVLCYQDGILADSFTMASATMGDAGNPLVLGAGYNIGLRDYWQGQEAHVTIINGVPTLEQIKTLYLCGRDGQ